MKKASLVLFLVWLVSAFFFFDLHEVLTLGGVQDSLDHFESWRAASPLLVAGAFFVFYVLVTAVSLPVATLMTLVGGALFGLLWGLVIISFASSIGALLAFLVSRYLLRDAVQSRFGDSLKTLNEGIEKDGAFYLFSLRLVPVFPFFIINLLMGLTPIPARTYYWATQLGMLAVTAVFVNAGTQLGQLESVSGILSPKLLLSFVLLALFPLLAKKMTSAIQRRRVYAQ